MADQTTPDLVTRLATLEATVQWQSAELARQRRQQRRWHAARRLPPLILAALLVALIPLATLAANPFNDLNANSVHNPNIDAIFNAGITTGCDPGVSYCPNGLVTREEMASFLARTAGLGTNPPVANALTAQTATNAGNADTLGGYAPSELSRIAFSRDRLTNTLPNTTTYTDIVRVTLTIPGNVPQAVAVRGAFNAYGQNSGGNIVTGIRQDGAANAEFFRSLLFFPYQTTRTDIGISPHAEWIFVAPPGTHTYTLVAYAASMAGPLIINQPRLIATTHPFGATGDPGATEIDPAPQDGGDRPRP